MHSGTIVSLILVLPVLMASAGPITKPGTVSTPPSKANPKSGPKSTKPPAGPDTKTARKSKPHITEDAHAVGVDETTGHLTKYGKDGRTLGAAKGGKGNSTATTHAPSKGNANAKPDALKKPAVKERQTPSKGIGQSGPKKVKRASSSCAPLTPDDLRKLPGWAKLEASARASWGQGDYNLVTNPPEYMDRPAIICVDDAPAKIQFEGKPDCTIVTFDSEGKMVGTEGEVKLTQTSGVEAEAVSTVTQASSISVGVELTASLEFPGIGGLSATTRTETSFSNSVSKENRYKVSSATSHELTIKAPQGKTCHLQAKQQSCTQGGKGQIRYIAEGWAWFNFHDRTNGHYKWALNIKDAVPEVSERMTTLEFKTKVNSQQRNDWETVCK